MIDYHLHSEISADAIGTIKEICQKCIELGLEEICFTDHLDFDPSDLCYEYYDYSRAKKQIDEAQDIFQNKISIKFGVEIDYQKRHHNLILDYLHDKQFDYILGSAHYVDGIIIEDHKRLFSEKIEEEIYDKYFDVVYSVIDSGLFDTLAHLDLCKRYGVLYYGNFDSDKYSEKINDILKYLISKNMTLEVNSSGLRQSPNNTYPDYDIIKLYYDIGGRNIITGSDSHSPTDVGKGILEATKIIYEIGFKEIDTFNSRIRNKRLLDMAIDNANK
ncbi:MAG: histidinol-phosphatase HisJ family protein [Armatimonadota bacterium]